MRAVRPRDSDEKIEGDVTARTERQEIFSQDNPPMAWFVLDESILHRPLGGNHVMRNQLIKLEKMAEQTNVVIQVMPFTATGHPGVEGPLRILEFLDSAPIWYTEGWYSGADGGNKGRGIVSYDVLRPYPCVRPSARRIATDDRRGKVHKI